jgi:adenine specific DNA methylase Mod
LPNAVTCKIPLGDYEKFACMALSNLKWTKCQNILNSTNVEIRQWINIRLKKCQSWSRVK